jgi:hypothetical protein
MSIYPLPIVKLREAVARGVNEITLMLVSRMQLVVDEDIRGSVCEG